MTRTSAAATTQDEAAARRKREALESQRPGSSKPDDAKVGQISARARRKIPYKKLRVYRAIQWTLSPPIRRALNVERIGVDKIPKKGPVILASNHVSWFDPVVVVTSIRRPLSALGKAYIFRGWARTFFFETLGGQIRVDRESRGNMAAVETAVEAVNAGRLLSVWPEGGRSPTGHLTRGKTGVARIALASGAPVYPVAVIGTHELKAKHAKKIKWGTPVKLIVGDPMTFPDLVGKQHDRALCRKVTDDIMMEIAKLMGPDEAARYKRLLKEDVPPGELPLDAPETA